MPDNDSATDQGYTVSPFAAAPAAPAPEKPYDLDPKFKLPPSYFMPPGADGTSPAAASVFSGQYDAGGGGGGGGNPLDAAAGNLDQTLQHPGGSPVGINAGEKAVQVAPQGGIIPGLIDKVQIKPYIEGVPGMGPPGMPPPWDPGH
jgi:hypothetical protein